MNLQNTSTNLPTSSSLTDPNGRPFGVPTLAEPDFVYNEPTNYPIGKRERFDEDNMKPLLQDEDFNKKDRKRLSDYNKHRMSGGKISVSYKFGKGCDEHRLGRLFPDEGIGLQSFRFDMRNPLAAKNYWDTDFANAHYCIALYHAQKLGLQTKFLTQYVNEREKVMAMISTSRKKAKTEMLKTLYLGNIKLYSEFYEDVDGDITDEGYAFIMNLSKEVETLALVLWENHPQYHKLKMGKDSKSIAKKSNPKASLMSLLFQTEERKMLMVWDAFLAYKKRYMAVFIHDGGYVEKLENETAFPQELLAEGSAMVKKYTGISSVLTQKNIEFEWKPNIPDEDQYTRLKKSFEMNTFLVGTQLYHIMRDGTPCYMSVKNAEIKFAPLKVQQWDSSLGKCITKSFLEMWIADPERLEYDRVDFFPNVEKCPPSVYNLFKGFNAEQYEPDEAMSPETIAELVEPIIKHVGFITSGDGDYFLKLMANIIQHPDRKSEIATLIRDMGNMLEEGGGTGKNLLVEYIGNQIIGEDYCIVVGDNKELYGNFNSLFEGKLLVFVEEACGKENHGNNDTLKARITSKKTNINKKQVQQYRVNDYANYVFTSNSKNPLPIKQGNRRFCVFDSNTEMRGNVKYFTDFVAHIEQPEVKWAFFQYLKTLDTYKSPSQFSANIPITNAYREVRMLNAPIYLKWLVTKVEKGHLHNEYTSELYREYSHWVSENKEKSMDTIISKTAFGLMLANTECIHESYEIEDQGDKTKKHGTMYMQWNNDGVVNGLKNLHLLSPDFKYKSIPIIPEIHPNDQ